MKTPSTRSFFASCPLGLEALLLSELEDLGAQKAKEVRGGIRFEATLLEGIELALYTKLASRIMLSLKSGSVTNSRELQTRINQIPWEGLFAGYPSLRVKTVLAGRLGKRHGFENSHTLSLMVKDAIVDRYRDKTGERPNVDTKNPDTPFFIHLSEDSRGKVQFEVYLDLIGRPLSDRGIRDGAHHAPLRENLAQGLWQLIKAKQETQPKAIVDLMTGSGTFIVEALMDLYELPGQYFQLKFHDESFPFDHLQDVSENEALLKKIDLIIQNIIDYKVPRKQKYNLEAFDQNISKARRNLEYAGIDHLVRLGKKDALSYERPREGSLLFTNPPYGVRLGEEEEATQLFKDLGERAKNHWQGCKWFVIGPHGQQTKHIRLKPSFKAQVFNGPIDCRLLGFDLY